MTAVLFGTFNARHAANALLAGDLRRAGLEVRLCHEPLWEEARDKDARYFGAASLVRLGARWAAAATRLARRFRGVAAGADLAVAGFNGQLDVLLLRRIARPARIVFAPLVTVTETLVDDRGVYTPRSAAARLAALLDRASLAAADLVLLDTTAHRDWAVARFGVDRARVLVHYLGAESAFAPVASAPAAGRGDRLRVLFYGQYLPLHGTEVIAHAARALGPEAGIDFELVGTGTERAASDAIVAGLPHVRRTDWVPYEELPARIAAADVVLGIFGRSDKARMVVPNKVYQAAQVGRAIVTADTPAIREVFEPERSIVAIAPEPEALAGALRALAADPVLRERLGRGAREAVARVASPEVRAARLAGALRALAPGAPLPGVTPGAVPPAPGAVPAPGAP